MKEEFVIVYSPTGGKYKVSNYGYVISYCIKGERSYQRRGTSHSPKIIKAQNNGSGYMYVSIGNGYDNRKYLHRLIAELFLPNNHNKPCVNHIDGNKSNNHVSNLEWCTFSENNKHAVDSGLRGKGANSQMSIKVLTINGLEFGCIKDAATYFNLNYGTVKDGLNRYHIYKGMFRADKVAMAS